MNQPSIFSRIRGCGPTCLGDVLHKVTPCDILSPETHCAIEGGSITTIPLYEQRVRVFRSSCRILHLFPPSAGTV